MIVTISIFSFLEGYNYRAEAATEKAFSSIFELTLGTTSSGDYEFC